ncbi:nuclease-related domain-containing protein [Nocardia amikacinitolerans]|uniref:nuclease-related domain-containing protein n=1 Tax=Nocardia amikacinitolerans TaxID=756689 RepID=UPI000BE31057|nr:nuclease-related domain-containing protein [Nocardia amikacinitolerans]
MLVKIRPGAQLSGAEQEFVDCLRSFPTTGLAAIDAHVGDNGTRQIDAVLITPRGITVVEVRGFRRRQSGILHVAADEPWTISDTPADLDDESNANPAERLEQSVYAVKSKLERALLDPGHVCGVVALVPLRGVVVRPARTNLRSGIDVVVANVPDSTELRIYIESFAAGPRSWSADRVISAATALGVTAPSRAELIADGFDELAPHSHMPVPAAPPPRTAPPPPRPPTRSQHAATWAVVAVALIGILVVFGVVATAVARDEPHPAPETTTTVDPTPSPSRPRDCYPFQTDC